MRRLKSLKNLDNIAYSQMDSPVGCLTIFAGEQGIHCILWDIDLEDHDCKQALATFDRNNDHDFIVQAKNQLGEYFENKRKKFDLPIVLNGTPFQIQVWNELTKIPYAETICYSEQAQRLGDKNKARAVGLANGANPISIIVPCHRVIGANGHLTGFGGGLDKKSYLLQLEQDY
jgi:methylated-DNA-[protein]-cysteine S-methyltransferase